MKTITALLAAVALAGCANDLVWAHPAATEERYQADFGGCQSQAFSATGNSPYLGSTMLLRQQVMILQSCMRSKGWHQRQR